MNKGLIRLALAALLLTGISAPSWAEIPLGVEGRGITVDGRHCTQTAVTVPTSTYVTALSTDATRVDWFAQVTRASGRVYWGGASVSTNPATNMWLSEGDYFSNNNPRNWQGQVLAISTGATAATVVFDTCTDPKP